MKRQRKENSYIPPLVTTSTIKHTIHLSSKSPQMWIVKVPEVFAQIVQSTSSSDSFGSFITTSQKESSQSTAAGKKRIVDIKIEVNEKIIQSCTEESTDHIPLKYKLKLESHDGYRLISSSNNSKEMVIHNPVAYKGTLAVDILDPRYRVYTEWRKRKEAEMDTRVPTSGDAELIDIHGDTRVARSFDEIIPAHERKAISFDHVPKKTSVPSLFEVGAYWTKEEIMHSLGVNSAEATDLVHKYCIYVKSGKHVRHYVLQPQFRTPSMPKPEEETDT